jgi:outer membrane protein assembly factor BamA
MRFHALLLSIGIGVLPRVALGQAAAPAAQPAAVPILAAAPDLSRFNGRTIARVEVVVDVRRGREDVSLPVSVRVGEPFSAAAARQALADVLASGRFARGSVDAQDDGRGVVLQVHVVPRELIGRVRLDLHGAAVERDDLLRDVDLVEGGEVVDADLALTRVRIEKYFARHGFPAATVRVDLRPIDASRAAVFVDVVPGSARTIQSRQFYVFAAKESSILPVATSYAVRGGDRDDEPAIDQADAALEQALKSRGWVHAVVSHDVFPSPSAQGEQLVLRVRIDAGPLLVARFEGNEHYDGDVLTAVLDLAGDSDRSLSHLSEKVRTFYQKRGFLDAEVQAEERRDSEIELVVFHVAERDRVRVTRRTYPCLKLETVQELEQGPRSPGDVGTEIDSFLDEELPGTELLVTPNPQGLESTIGGGAGALAHGTRPVPIDLSPGATYMADTYVRAVEHLRELYRSEGFLHAEVGPVEVRRDRCDPRAPAGTCVPVRRAAPPAELCAYDASGLPTPTAPPDPASFCRPDAARGIECAPSVELAIPIRLGPRTWLWDLSFTGVKNVGERAVAEAAHLSLGEPANTAKLEEARRRIVDWYKELGYYYVDVKYALEPSPDNTRARVRFDVVEGDQVVVRDIIVRGLDHTNEGVVRRRIALQVEAPYRTSDVRTTQERIATLGVFSSVTVSLSEPYVPQARKDVIIEVAERDPQYIEVRPGFSTGEGIRGAFEYGHRNLLGDAWAVTLHLQASYLPDFLILDPQVAKNYHTLPTSDRIATRNTLTMSWPEIGLGPTVRAELDGIYVRDLERDFTLFKASVLGSLIWRPVRELQVRAGPDYEHNDVFLFQAKDIATYLLENPGNADLARLLRVPDGDSNVVAGNVVVTWDRRDTAFNAHRGTYVALGIEQVNSYPVQGTASAAEQYEGHFFRLTQTLAAYLPLSSSVTFAAELRLGEIANVIKCRLPFLSGTTTSSSYCTYPDRLFFMGGFDSMRGWLQDTFIPQEYADQIAADAYKSNSDPTKFTAANIPLRGGNLMVNPRFELRFPIRLPLEGAIFGDLGNLWADPNDFIARPLVLRADVGAGVRVDTPVGPLVFDYGINVTRRPYEDFGAFHFAIGLF